MTAGVRSGRMALEREWSPLAIVPLARRLQEDGLIRAGCIEFCPGWGCNPAKDRPRLMFGFYGLGIEPGVSCMLDKHCTNELYPQPDS